MPRGINEVDSTAEEDATLCGKPCLNGFGDARLLIGLC